MSEAADFAKRAAQVAQDQGHRHKLLRVIGTYDAAVSKMKVSQFHYWEGAREIAREIKLNALDRLPSLLEEFERRIVARGAEVLWAETAHEAQDYLSDIVKKHSVTSVVKSKSMTTEEIYCNELLESKGVVVKETDLGELIVQLAKERPYHIVTPAMHKSKAQISTLFQEKLQAPQTEDAEVLTRVARDHLRAFFANAEMGITGANFLIADDGAVVLTENEGNARLSFSCPPVHVVIAGIEKILPRLEDLALFLPLLATSGTGQRLTTYNSIIRGPRGVSEPDGPKHMYVILLDNGRSNLFLEPEFRESLACIRCGACLNACPVYRVVGGHSYNTAYPGPIGAVITPHLKGFEKWNHLSYASSLCGACSEVCPVGINIHHLLLKNRLVASQSGAARGWWNPALRIWRWSNSSRKRLENLRRFAHGALSIVNRVRIGRGQRALPALAPKSFSELWRKHGCSRKHP